MEDIFELIKDDTHQARAMAKEMMFFYIRATVNWNKPTPMKFKNHNTNEFYFINITTQMLKDIIEGRRNENSGDFLTAYINFYNMECKKLNIKTNKDEGLNILNYFNKDLNAILNEFRPRIKAMKVKTLRRKKELV